MWAFPSQQEAHDTQAVDAEGLHPRPGGQGPDVNKRARGELQLDRLAADRVIGTQEAAQLGEVPAQRIEGILGVGEEELGEPFAAGRGFGRQEVGKQRPGLQPRGAVRRAEPLVTNGAPSKWIASDPGMPAVCHRPPPIKSTPACPCCHSPRHTAAEDAAHRLRGFARRWTSWIQRSSAKRSTASAESPRRRARLPRLPPA